jgi:hypothetical protein
MSTPEYLIWRQQHHAQMMAHRQLRSIRLGEHVLLQFESEITVRYQIQEMLRIEQISEDNDIAHEIEVYAPLVPIGTHWKATLMIQYTDPLMQQTALQKLVGLEDCVDIQVEGFSPVKAIADEDLDRKNKGKTSAVHFLRWELSALMRQAIRTGSAVTIVCDHPHYMVNENVSSLVLESLKSDLH